MDRKPGTHFHIRWIHENTSRTHWEAFASRDDAEAMAKQITTPPETYQIAEFDSSCERCAMFRLLRGLSS